MLNRHMWLVVPKLDSTKVEHSVIAETPNRQCWNPNFCCARRVIVAFIITAYYTPVHKQAGQKLQILISKKIGIRATSHPVSNPSPFKIFHSVPWPLVGLFSIIHSCFCFVTPVKKTWQDLIQLQKLYGFDIRTIFSNFTEWNQDECVTTFTVFPNDITCVLFFCFILSLAFLLQITSEQVTRKSVKMRICHL